MGRSQRIKGANGEREVSKKFKERGWDLDRVPNSGGLKRRASELGDLYGDLEAWTLEVKRQEALRIMEWCHQVEGDAKISNTTPALIFRKNNEPWRVVITLDQFLDMLRIYEDAKGKGKATNRPRSSKTTSNRTVSGVSNKTGS